MLFVIIVSQAKAQKSNYNTNYRYEREEINYSIYSNQIDKSINLLKSFFEANKIQLTTYAQNNGFYEYKFSINETLVNSLDSLVNLLGFRASKSIKNDSKKSSSVIELTTNIEHLNDKKASYEKLISKMDSVKGKEYLFYFEKIVTLDDEIFQQTLLLKEAQIREKTQVVEINLHDDYATSDYSDIMFVHMPGAEYSMMFIENPTQGISAVQYQGYSLKYLFTRGKSYFSIGAMKPLTALAATDSSVVKDIFSLTFGQDFYNRHLGRGKRKFLNLYIGYQAGISNARNFNSDKVFAMVAPVTGLELFKNKYFNLDINGSYFIPLNDFSYTLRGIKVNASLNFSF
ncbi:MAG: hypothetical protein K0S32_4282 [Bacteroidetes bacterium]|jgi:hypothetical protein|nr:hypothetical protein [Bacteroidota bacterium]